MLLAADAYIGLMSLVLVLAIADAKVLPYLGLRLQELGQRIYAKLWAAKMLIGLRISRYGIRRGGIIGAYQLWRIRRNPAYREFFK
jgi:hypothetical protein